jgi:hypothetical protein
MTAIIDKKILSDFFRKEKPLLKLLDLEHLPAEIRDEVVKKYIDSENEKINEHDCIMLEAEEIIKEKLKSYTFGTEIMKILTNMKNEIVIEYKSEIIISEHYSMSYDCDDECDNKNMNVWKLPEYITSTPEYYLLYCDVKVHELFNESNKPYKVNEDSEIIKKILILTKLGIKVLIYNLRIWRKGYDSMSCCVCEDEGEINFYDGDRKFDIGEIYDTDEETKYYIFLEKIN